MSSLSIKIVLAGRTYPLNVKQGDEENVRKAVKKIEDSLNYFSENYAVKDKQDLLAMTALQMAVQGLEQENSAQVASDKRSLELILGMLNQHQQTTNTTV